MGREFPPILLDRTFQIAGKVAIVRVRKDPDMVSADDEPEHTEDEVEAPVLPLRISEWLWRPWYAKIWWTSIPVYWLGMAASSFVPPLADFYASGLAGFLNILFYPVTALLVLGVGFARAWLDRIEWGGEGRAMVHEELFPRPVIVPSTDRFDPRSGSLYVGSDQEWYRRHES